MKGQGRSICRILKDIRMRIAQENDIELVIQECTFQGECSGTCPRCEAEVAYLERELDRRRKLGKVVSIAGLAGVALAAQSCIWQTAGEEPNPIEGDPVYIPDTTTCPTDTIDEKELPTAGDPYVWDEPEE